LIHKFETIGLQTLGEILEMDKTNFEKIKGVGKTSVKEFNDFKSDVTASSRTLFRMLYKSNF
jgi:hypothetical protein